MAGIEGDNPALKGVLPKDYARPALDKTRLGQLIDLISNIKVGDETRQWAVAFAGGPRTGMQLSAFSREHVWH